MASYDAGASSNMIYGYAFEGVWKKYSEPSFRRWIWTLTALKAILVLGAYALLLTLTQSRTWVVVRHFVLSKNKTVRLEGDLRPNPLQHLSQASALKDLFLLIVTRMRLWRKYSFRRSVDFTDSMLEADSPIISPWFGICAIMNIVVFSILGVALPVIFSEGMLEMPLVRSKLTAECFNSDSVHDREINLTREQQTRTDAIFDMCLDPLSKDVGASIIFNSLESADLVPHVHFHGTFVTTARKH
jgi:hypothetical protein